MYRLRLLLGLALTGFGAIVILDGPRGLGRAIELVWANSGGLLLMVAAIAVFASVNVRRIGLGPVTLTLIGLALLALQLGVLTVEAIWRGTGVAALGFGGWIAMATGRPTEPSVDPTWRRLAVLFPRRIQLRQGEQSPRQLRIISIGAHVAIDLRNALPPATDIVELSLACWGSHIDLLLPGHWRVVAGRVDAIPAITLVGALDDTRVFPDVHDPTAAQDLRLLIAPLAGATGRCSPPAQSGVVVVNVIGLGGEIRLVGRD